MSDAKDKLNAFDDNDEIMSWCDRDTYKGSETYVHLHGLYGLAVEFSDEIERLRAALEQIAEGSVSDHPPTLWAFARAALDGQPMLSGWRLIETAPTDGTWVLCFGTVEDEGGDYDKERKIFTAQFTNFCNGARREKGWWQFAWFDGGFYGRCKPTHWMPLPPAPGKEEV